jgi:hypothetical protein
MSKFRKLFDFTVNGLEAETEKIVRAGYYRGRSLFIEQRGSRYSRTRYPFLKDEVGPIAQRNTDI